MSKRCALSFVLIVVSILLHLTFCEWRKLEMSNSWSMVDEKGRVIEGSDSEGKGARADSLEGFSMTIERIAEALGRSRGSIWLNTDAYGEGFGLYARGRMDVDTARFLGVISPILMLIAVPIVLIAGKKAAPVAILFLAFAMLPLNSGGCTTFVPEDQQRAQRQRDLARSRGEIIEFRVRPNPYAKYRYHSR